MSTRARLSPVRSAPSRTPPAARNASATLDPEGSSRMPGLRTFPLTSTTMCPPGPVPGGGPGDGSGSPAPSGSGGDVRACAASSTGSGARTECGRADQRCIAAKTPAATSTTANAARVFGSRPHLSCSHTGSRSRSAGTTLSRHRPAPPETGTVTEAEDEPLAEMEAPAATPTGLGRGLGLGLGLELRLGLGLGLGRVTVDEAGAESCVGTTPSTGRATRPPYAPVISASARRRDAAATVSVPRRDVRRRPGPRPGPKPGPAPTPGPVPGPLRTRPSEAGARPGPLPLPLVARCDRGAMPHDGRHIRPKPLNRTDSGGQPTSCG